jgi:hypothetical protein
MEPGDGKFGYSPRVERGYAPTALPQAKLPRPVDAGPADTPDASATKPGK